MPRSYWLPDPKIGVVAIVIAALAGVSLLNYQRNADSTYQAATQKYEQTKIVAPAGASPKGQYTNPKSYRDEWRSEQDLAAQRGMVFWAKYLLVVTAVGVLLVGATLWETRKAAQAAEEVVTVTRETAERQLRAYVMIDHERTQFKHFDETVSFHVCIKNSGQTPAYTVRSWISVRGGNYPPDIQFVREGPHGESVVTLAPNSIIWNNVSVGRRMSDDIKQQLRTGTHAIYCYGEIAYRDAFGQDRLTRFRLMLGGPMGVSNDGSMTNCEEGNDAT